MRADGDGDGDGDDGYGGGGLFMLAPLSRAFSAVVSGREADALGGGKLASQSRLICECRGLGPMLATLVRCSAVRGGDDTVTEVPDGE